MAIVAVVGSGLIGQSWAAVFARAGFRVRLYDADKEALARASAGALARLRDLKQGELLEASPQSVAQRIKTVPDLAEAVAEADYVQENVPESVEAKAAVFELLDRHAPSHAVLASSSSTIAASRFTGELAGRERCLVAHPVNPPHLVPVVELVPAPWTDRAAVERTRDLMTQAGQAPIVVKAEIEGFVLNRLQAALLAEALRLAAAGYASVEDIDTTVKRGLGLRWAFMGPFETIDLNAPGGIDDYLRRYGPAFRRILEDPVAGADPWSGEAGEMVTRQRIALLAREDLGKRAVWRDRRLTALLAHLKGAESGKSDA
jgi:L-gulonate 3-dehydrogenase